MSAALYGHTAHYRYIDDALRDRWEGFIALEREILSWEPKSLAAFGEAREAELARLMELNPGDTAEELAPLVDGQLRSWASSEMQFHREFDRRLMSEYVVVVNLAHALSEALINAALAIGLAQGGAVELFGQLEKTDFRQKWLTAPKSINPDYTFPKGSALYETLTYLARQRNALVHHKIELEMSGRTVLEGSDFRRLGAAAELKWLRRFHSLPYDLADFLFLALPGVAVLFDRRPIQVALEHRSAFGR